MKTKEKKEVARIIKALGGATRISELFAISPQACSAWRRKGIPPARMMYLRLAYPELFTPHNKPEDKP